MSLYICSPRAESLPARKHQIRRVLVWISLRAGVPPCSTHLMKRALLASLLLIGACGLEATPNEASDSSEERLTTCPASPTSHQSQATDVITHGGLTEAQKCELAKSKARTGDVLFTQIDSTAIGRFVLGHVAEVTSSWTSHAGIVIHENGEILVAESTIGKGDTFFDRKSRKTPICTFLEHSKENRFTLRRRPRPLTPVEDGALRIAINKRMGMAYDTGFDLDEQGTSYCSKFVYEIFNEALNTNVGRIQTLREIVDEKKAQDPSYSDALVRLWFVRPQVPWCRRMVTPASQLLDPDLQTIVATD